MMDQPNQDMRRAVAERNYPEVQRMVTEGVQIHPKLWFAAIQAGDADVCSLLMTHGLDPNDSGSDHTPLHYAAEGGQFDIAKRLLERGANPNARDRNGLTPLDLCCEFAVDDRVPEMLTLLIEAGTELSFATAIRVGSLKHVSDHLNHSPEALDEIPPAGTGTPLMMACRCGRTAIVQDLLLRGADLQRVSAKDIPTGTGGNTALWYASQGNRSGRGSLVRLLLRNGAEANAHGEHGDTALHASVAWRHIHSARELLEGGADPNSENERGETPEDYALKWGFRELQQMVHAYGGHSHRLEATVI